MYTNFRMNRKKKKKGVVCMNQAPCIIVRGFGEVLVEPNQAEVILGVQTMNRNASEAQQQNAQTINQVIQSIVQLGIPQQHIQTVNYSIFPQYDYIDGKQHFRGYQVTHELRVIISQISILGNVIDEVTKAGVNQFNQVTFSINQQEYYYQQALILALTNAYNKAHALTHSLQQFSTLYPAKIIELINPSMSPYQAKTFQAEQATSIAPGQLSVQAELEVTYLLYN
jgi:uncharacterized protein